MFFSFRTALLSASIMVGGSFAAADHLTTKLSSPKKIARVLQVEAGGKAVNRRSLLGATAGSKDPKLAWHAGRVLDDAGWQNIENLGNNSPELTEYRSKRRELKDDPIANLKLARWCIKQGFTLRARAHYAAVLSGDRDNLEARKFLGHVRVGLDWVEKETAEKASQRAQEVAEKIQEWAPVFARILRKVEDNKARVVIQGLKELEQVDGVDALPALEFIACNAKDEVASLCVKKISGLRSVEACMALVRVAVVRDLSKARDAAIVALRRYPEGIYVPELLGCLVGKVSVRNEIVFRPDGQLSLSTLIGQEMRDKQLRKKIDNAVNVMAFVNTAQITYSENADRVMNMFFIRRPYVPREVEAAASIKLKLNAHQRERAGEALNMQIVSQNKRIYEVLDRVTEEKIEQNPEAWWSWWTERSERLELRKPVYSESYVTRESLVVDMGLVVSGFLSQCSCLIPGTLVQTETGLRPIEKIRVGDKVVAQDVETGELALKGVSETTVRPPETTYVIHLDGDKIQATGGHLWWVSGQGWVQTKKLKAGQLLHTATGTSEIQSLEESKAVQTHNLVVDQFSTYFVGKQRVLSYDNSIVKPTMKLVPGYEPQP